MTFFSRPDFDNIQFKQLTGSTITLSGETKIADLSGLKLNSGDGIYRPIIVTGGTNGFVLTLRDNRIVLEEGGSGGTGVYHCASPTTITVGGLPSNTPISGCGYDEILQRILVPTLSPTLYEPYYQFTIEPSTSMYEVGTKVNICGKSIFNRGGVNPIYCGGTPFVVGLPTCYCYFDFDSVDVSCYSPSSANTVVFSQRIIDVGASNIVRARVHYSTGIAPFNSTGGTAFSARPAGSIPSTGFVSRTINGVYPYFWGKSVGVGVEPKSKPIPNQLLIAGGTKVVQCSNNDITIDFNANAEFIWLAVPSTTPDKNCWVASNNPTNNGSIPGSLFDYPIEDKNISIDSPQGCWGNIPYNFYISSSPTSTFVGSPSNTYSITFKKV